LTKNEPKNKKGEIKIKLNKSAIKQVIGVFAGKLNKMLNEDINESVEIGSKKSGKARMDYGIKMKFLDDPKVLHKPHTLVRGKLQASKYSKQKKKLFDKDKDIKNIQKKKTKED
jgi:hypothetical protein